VVQWLQAGRSQVRFPMSLLQFFIDIILSGALWPWGRLGLLTEMSRVHLKCNGTRWRTEREVNWQMEWVRSTLHTTSELGVSSITTADAHTSTASSRLNWRPCRFKWTRPFRRNTKSGFCACAITFQTHSTRNISRSVKAAGA
jgi:hypothetical protein